MSDVELIKLCADAMELTLLPAYRKGTILYDEGQHDWNGLMYSKDGDREYLFTQSGAYDPLHDDEQAMALVKAHTLDVTWGMGELRWRVGLWGFVEPTKEMKQGVLCEVRGYDLNRCIVESVAQLQQAGKL